MPTVDPISDMLTRIRNALMVRHESVDVPYSNVKLGISKILKEEGYIRNYKIFVDEQRKKHLKVYISYDDANVSVITGLKRISKPGRKVYAKVGELPKLTKRIGMVVLSTSHGLMTDKNAKKNNVGGEPLLLIW
ncbi:MAG: 30S ribosomal protein S8 [Proteobacteria bacterium]|nr:30S ribosomal protein S8 [Pseudomonadota bacterium]